MLVSDQVDVEILERVYEAGGEGVLPKDMAAAFPEHPLQHYNVTRRIQWINKRLIYETGELLFEKRGWEWALTRFAFDLWNEKQVKSENVDAEENWQNQLFL